MVAAAALSTLAARDASLADQLKSTGTWNALFSGADSILLSGSSPLLERLTEANDGAALQAFASLLASVLRFHASAVPDETPILNLLLSLILSEKKLGREAATSVVEALHPTVPALAGKLLNLFHSVTLPKLAARRLSTEYLDGSFFCFSLEARLWNLMIQNIHTGITV